MMHDTAIILLALTAVLPGQAADPDRDRDGLSDVLEVHKYLTNPHRKDSDGDGTPDGDWKERREYAYTVRTIVHVMRPVDIAAANDDYQDARLLEEHDKWVEMEVVHYPFCTIADDIEPDPGWRRTAKRLSRWTRPGLTANWNGDMKERLVAALKKDGIDVSKLTDKDLVKKASAWLLEHANHEDGGTTFSTHFENGKPTVLPDFNKPEKNERGHTLLEQWDREAFARGMFDNGVRGSCTSSAIYLNGCLRALGIPTRIVYCIPLVDASDEREVLLVRKGLTHRGVRSIVEESMERLGRSWASHTFNEVFVGGRWRRLNYQKLGQGVLDRQFMGLMTHVATFDDWADARMPFTVGLRQGSGDKSGDVFGGSNPYSAISVSDRLGAHCKLDPTATLDPDEFTRLTITEVTWYGDPSLHPMVSMGLDGPEASGHLIVKVKEGRKDGGASQYRSFYRQVGKDFVLRAKGNPEVRLRATRGYWAKPAEGVQHFYLRIEPDEYRRMKACVPYDLVALNGDPDYQWVVEPGVRLVRDIVAAAVPETAKNTMTIDGAVWSDSGTLRSSLRRTLAGQGLCLLLHVKEWQGFEHLKAFTADADQRFYLQAEGHPRLGMSCGTGGLTNSDGSVRYLILPLGPADLRDLHKAVTYTLRPRNDSPTHHWLLPKPITLTR